MPGKLKECEQEELSKLNPIRLRFKASPPKNRIIKHLKTSAQQSADKELHVAKLLPCTFLKQL